MKPHMSLAFKILHSFMQHSLFSQKCLACCHISLHYSLAQVSVSSLSQYLSHSILLNFILFQFLFNHFNFRVPGFHLILFFVCLFACLFTNLRFKESGLLQSSSLALNLIGSSPSIPLGL